VTDRSEGAAKPEASHHRINGIQVSVMATVETMEGATGKFEAVTAGASGVGSAFWTVSPLCQSPARVRLRCKLGAQPVVVKITNKRVT